MLTALFLFCACNPKVTTKVSKTYPVLDYQKEVFVFGINDTIPNTAEIIGQVKVGDNGFTAKCDYETVLETAKLEARKAGGNAVKIVVHKLPSLLGSSCHRITADILRVSDIENYQHKNEDKILENVDYAILKVFRHNIRGSLINYDLYLGDSVICRVKNNFKKTIRIKKDGLNTLWAKTEKKTEIPIDIKFGKTYYLLCDIKMGIMVGRPLLKLLENKRGKMIFDSFEAKHQ